MKPARPKLFTMRVEPEDKRRMKLVADHFGLDAGALVRMLVKREADLLEHSKKGPGLYQLTDANGGAHPIVRADSKEAADGIALEYSKLGIPVRAVPAVEKE